MDQSAASMRDLGRSRSNRSSLRINLPNKKNCCQRTENPRRAGGTNEFGGVLRSIGGGRITYKVIGDCLVYLGCVYIGLEKSLWRI